MAINLQTSPVVEVIRAKTEQQKISMLALSEMTGIPRTTLRRRMIGLTPFTAPELTLIAAALDVGTHELFQNK